MRSWWRSARSLENSVVIIRQSFGGQPLRHVASPDDFALETRFPHQPVEHHPDVMAGVPVAMIEETPGRLEDASKLLASGEHELDIGFVRGVAILERPLLFRLSPEDFV